MSRAYPSMVYLQVSTTSDENWEKPRMPSDISLGIGYTLPSKSHTHSKMVPPLWGPYTAQTLATLFAVFNLCPPILPFANGHSRGSRYAVLIISGTLFT